MSQSSGDSNANPRFVTKTGEIIEGTFYFNGKKWHLPDPANMKKSGGTNPDYSQKFASETAWKQNQLDRSARDKENAGYSTPEKAVSLLANEGIEARQWN